MVDVLRREMYSEPEAARLLLMSPSTLHYWLEGGVRGRRKYQPVIRPEPHDRHAPVTWAEFIEAGLLRMYRRDHRVPMAELRRFIDRLRDEYQVPYPLADRRPYVAGRELVSRVQEEAELEADFCLVAEARGQYILAPAAALFFSRVTWRDDDAVAWRPHNEPASPVRMQPTVRFGRPAVGGVSTAAIREQLDAGASADEVATLFELTIHDVHWADAYETSVRAA